MIKRLDHLALLFCAFVGGCTAMDVIAAQPDADTGSNVDALVVDGPPGTMAVATCTGGPDDRAATLGMGFNSQRPGECVAARGPDHAVSSAADVAALLVGTWTACISPPFGLPVQSQIGAGGISMTADGHYVLLFANAFSTLVPSSGVQPDAGADVAVTGPSDGTFEVVDGSATFGPGSYEIRLHPTGGGLASGQVIVTDAPRELHFFAPGQPDSRLIPSLPLSPRASVCSCVRASGTKVGANDASVLRAAMAGRWLRCDGGLGFGGSQAASVGIEFTADGSWFALNEDETGTLSRGSSDYDHGTITIFPTGSMMGPMPGPEPLTIDLNQTTRQAQVTQVVVTSNPRALFLNVGTSSDGHHVTPTYALLFPMP